MVCGDTLVLQPSTPLPSTPSPPPLPPPLPPYLELLPRRQQRALLLLLRLFRWEAVSQAEKTLLMEYWLCSSLCLCLYLFGLVLLACFHRL